MANNDKFRASFKARIEKTKGKTELFVKKLIVDIDKAFVQASPVDLGTFKRNWMIGNGVINTTTVEAVSGASKGQYEAYNLAVITSLKVNGQVIYITNSLPYAKRLEDGYSRTQAPLGIVKVRIAELNTMANKIAAELRLV
jgi:hypothetical protein